MKHCKLCGIGLDLWAKKTCSTFIQGANYVPRPVSHSWERVRTRGVISRQGAITKATDIPPCDMSLSWWLALRGSIRGWTNSCVLAEITGFSFLYQILSMQLALWNKTAISWWAEFMDDKVLACLSESHFKDFLLSEITFFLVFDLCKSGTGESENGCRKVKTTHQKQRV